MKRIERFMQKVEKNEQGCWNWTGAGDKYGRFHTPDGLVYAHRWSYEHHVGSIPEGKTIDHLCENQRCVNPAHLEPVSRGENARRWVAKNKTHCAKGHEFTPENTYWHKAKHTKSGVQRVCRTCAIAKSRRQHEQRVRGRTT